MLYKLGTGQFTRGGGTSLEEENLVCSGRNQNSHLVTTTTVRVYLRILVYLVIYDSAEVSLEHLLVSWYPSQRLSPGWIVFEASVSAHARTDRKLRKGGLPATRNSISRGLIPL